MAQQPRRKHQYEVSYGTCDSTMTSNSITQCLKDVRYCLREGYEIKRIKKTKVQ